MSAMKPTNLPTLAKALDMTATGWASIEAQQVLAAEVKRLQALLGADALEKQAAIDERFVR